MVSNVFAYGRGKVLFCFTSKTSRNRTYLNGCACRFGSPGQNRITRDPSSPAAVSRTRRNAVVWRGPVRARHNWYANGFRFRTAVTRDCCGVNTYSKTFSGTLIAATIEQQTSLSAENARKFLFENRTHRGPLVANNRDPRTDSRVISGVTIWSDTHDRTCIIMPEKPETTPHATPGATAPSPSHALGLKSVSESGFQKPRVYAKSAFSYTTGIPFFILLLLTTVIIFSETCLDERRCNGAPNKS